MTRYLVHHLVQNIYASQDDLLKDGACGGGAGRAMWMSSLRCGRAPVLRLGGVVAG
jgi:hypothetical protein